MEIISTLLVGGVLNVLLWYQIFI